MSTVLSDTTQSDPAAERPHQGRSTKTTYRLLWLVTAVLLAFGATSLSGEVPTAEETGVSGELAAAPEEASDPEVGARDQVRLTSSTIPTVANTSEWKTSSPSAGAYGPAAVSLGTRAADGSTLTDFYRIETTGERLDEVSLHSSLCAEPEVVQGDDNRDLSLDEGEIWLVRCEGSSAQLRKGVAFTVVAQGPASVVRGDWSSPPELQRG